MKKIKYLALASVLITSTTWAQTMPTQNGVATAPDGWLISNNLPKWWYRSQPSQKVLKIDTRQASKAEQQVIDRATQMMEQYPIKGLALIEGDKVLYEDFNAPAGPLSTFAGFSMGKTVVSMMVGQAICDGKLSLTTRADELLPELSGKQLGASTVRDLLRMASGTKAHGWDAALLTEAENERWRDGTINLVEVLAQDSNSSAERGFFSSYKPGEHFSYKGSNPVTLGIMVSRATGVTFAQWMQAKVFDPMGAADQNVVNQTKQGDSLAGGPVSMTLGDWIRFAMWLKKSSQAQGCFGDYVRQATTTQIDNGRTDAQRINGKGFRGYGYLTWTENEMVPNSFWAIGYGGQRIGWFTDSDKIVIAFSNIENWSPRLYELANLWRKASN